MDFEIEDPYDPFSMDTYLDPQDPSFGDLESMRHLSNVDYSLNSPMIADELEAFIRWLQCGCTDPRWNEDRWVRTKQGLFSGQSPTTIEGAATFTGWFGNFNLKRRYYIVRQFKMILEKAQADSEETKPVVDAFLRGWINHKGVTLTSKITLPEEELKWGYYFWELHIVTLHLNCTTDQERTHLIKSFKSKSRGLPDVFDFTLYTRNFGPLSIAGGYVYMFDHNRMLDRNAILMMKDTYVARFNSFLALSNRADCVFPEDAHYRLQMLYEIGDMVLDEGGTSGYNGLKLLEAMCSSRITDLAQSKKPLIPDFPDFRSHVRAKVREESANTPSIGKMYELIEGTTSYDTLLTFYGSFRHWGHPYINYLAGLEKLYIQTTVEKEIDQEYVEKLASDLAFLVIQDRFRKTKKWPVDPLLIDKDHPLVEYIRTSSWPNNSIIKNFGDGWHTLPLTKCYDIPDVIDPSLLYSDKSHSMTRSEVRGWMTSHPGKPIPSRKVLSTLLNSPSTNWPVFLQQVNDSGIPIEQLIIGLMAKEREQKIDGRFFSLMSWDIRDYFVMTEYLIKTHFVPLFKGLTMADDLTTVIGKILENSRGQGEADYENLTITDHIDYEKWNNHQRGEANNPIFLVMGKFLGYPHLIERTHEIFEKSWIYYLNRADLMDFDGEGNLMNRTELRVCWNGQKGGLEGLRQKGWSICNLLVLRRESLATNTVVKTLAQGDNQVLSSRYRIRTSRDQNQLQSNIEDICRNNRSLMERIRIGTGKLGLIINHDETIKSTEYMNYGKTCVIHGNIRNLETKRWSRVTCVTNDQLPTLSNVMATIGSNALTVSHYSDSPINSMYHYNFMGNFVRIMNEIHNPALRGPVSSIEGVTGQSFSRLSYLLAVLYLDPSMGGACGMSLTRFLIRMFPDPITESLTFLRIVAMNVHSDEVRQTFIQFGNPKLKTFSPEDLSKLLEDPLSINVPKGLSATNLIKDAIKLSLHRSVDEIANEIIAEAVIHQKDHEEGFLMHLTQISPLFPRFLSEYKAGTYLGIAEGLIGLFQNSKTIRNQFRRNLDIGYDSIVIKSEIATIRDLTGYRLEDAERVEMWPCSSTQADYLRRVSWQQVVYGATIPHPAELFGLPLRAAPTCPNCTTTFPMNLYISVLIPLGFKGLKDTRGTCVAYLGSSTTESTGIVNPWEKEAVVPVIKRAASLRNGIGWFIEPGSNLAQSILNNLQSLTGESWSQNSGGVRRTGSALHRFSCSRQSGGGYTAQNPSKLTRMIATTNYLADLGDENYDFMYQSCLLNALISVGEIHPVDGSQGYYHQHVNCTSCLRPIKEVTLESPAPYSHTITSNLLDKWKPDGSKWSVSRPSIPLRSGKWECVSHDRQSYHVGFIQGFIYGDSVWGIRSMADDPALFPLSFRNKVNPRAYLLGILHGLLRSCTVSVVHQRCFRSSRAVKQTTLGLCSMTVSRLVQNDGFLNILRDEQFTAVFRSIPHRIPPSYPMVTQDIGDLASNYLKRQLMTEGLAYFRSVKSGSGNEAWIFADANHPMIVSLITVSGLMTKILAKDIWQKRDLEELKELRSLSVQAREQDDPHTDITAMESLAAEWVVCSDQETRHAVKYNTRAESVTDRGLTVTWGDEYTSSADFVTVVFSVEEIRTPPGMLIPRIQNPLISGLRTAQIATGSHYKLRSILSKLRLNVRGALVGGDGSGGLTALVCRMYPTSRVIFNSICDFSDVRLKGTTPAPPSALSHSLNDCTQVVNYSDSWAHPSDLTDTKTWKYFVDITKSKSIQVDLIILDMEVVDESSISKIEDNLMRYGPQLLTRDGVILFKTYLTRIFKAQEMILTKCGHVFSQVELWYSDLSSSQTSEVYVLMSGQTKLSHLQVRKPDLMQLRTDVSSFPVFAPPIVEFKRARKVAGLDLTVGVPPLLLPEPGPEMINLLSSLGVRPDISFSITRSFGDNMSTEFLPLHLFLLALNGIYDVTTGYRTPPGPPSDQVCIKLGIWIVGYRIWSGYVQDSYAKASFGQKLIDNFVPFNFWNKQIGRSWFPHWSLIKPQTYTKNIQLDSEMAHIGSVIRILHRNFPKARRNPPGDLVDNNCSRINKGISCLNMDMKTGILRWMGDGRDLSGVNVTTRISNFYVTQDDQTASFRN